jgi:hypothetical protein
LYSESTEKLAIPQSDVEIQNGLPVSDVDLIMTKLVIDPTEATFLNTLSPDSTDMIYSNMSDDARQFETNSKLYFWFRNNGLSKEIIVSGFTLTDSATGKAYKPVFNWLNDSLLEVFPFEKFTAGSTVDLKIDLTQLDPPVHYKRILHISDKPASSIVSGRIMMNDSTKDNLKLIMTGTAGSLSILSTDPGGDGRFSIKDVPEGTYRLTVFTDDNGNGIPDTGIYKPFKYSEKIRVYEKEVKVKSGWNIEDIVIEF